MKIMIEQLRSIIREVITESLSDRPVNLGYLSANLKANIDAVKTRSA